MTTVTIWRDQQKSITAFCAAGHSDDASESGQDIYCAAISAIVQTACIGLSDYIGAELKLAIEDGWLRCEFADPQFSQSEGCKAILETMLLGLRSFMTEYPGYLEIIEEVR